MQTLHRSALLLTILLISACAAKQPYEPTPEPEFTIDELKQRAEISSYAGAHKAALIQYQQVLAKDPDDVDALVGVGEALLGADMPKRAVNYLERALKIEPTHVKAREARAISWLMLGSYADARVSLNNLVADGEVSWRVWNSLGVIDDLYGDYRQAAVQYENAIALAPGRALLHNNLGYSRMMSHDYVAAETSLRKALLMAPGNTRIVNNLALTIAWQGRYDEALETLDVVLDEAAANNNVGYVAYLRKDYLRAKEMFSRAMRIRPSYYKKAAKNLEKVNRKLSQQ